MMSAKWFRTLSVAVFLLLMTASITVAQEVCEWTDETGWAAGERYVERGNWATYTEYEGEEKTVDLVAGRYLKAGTVHFSDPVDEEVTITITLNDGKLDDETLDDGKEFFFENVEENVKVQGYDSAPTESPSPGRFEHKGYAEGSTIEIVVPEYQFYGVHVNVEWLYCLEGDPDPVLDPDPEPVPDEEQPL
jgi:hypothetical protein